MSLLSKSNMDNHRLLASAALFRGMYTEQLDQFDVLAKFIQSTVTLNALHVFDVTECTSLLKQDFGFDIPEAVVRRCIRSKLKQQFRRIPSMPKWERTESFIPDSSLQQSFNDAQNEQSGLTLGLVTHVEQECKRSLSDVEKSGLIDDFYAHLKGLPRQNRHFSYIGHFILSVETTPLAKQILERTRQGLILFDGLRYSVEATGATLARDLVIYLDTEVLFSAAGFHGVLRQQLYKDLHSLVVEINQKAKKSSGRVALRYFYENTEEIEKYFSVAEAIANKRALPTPHKQAMVNILNGCANGADVIAKKVKFLQELRRLRVEQEINQNFYAPPTYNVESEAAVAALAEELSCDKEKAAYALRQFSRINFMRKGDNKTYLESVGFIFLSEKAIMRSAAFSDTVLEISGSGIPFSTDLDYMTEWFWLKLNKGFCTESHIPVAFDMIARTRLVLSAQLSSKVANEYQNLIEEYSKDQSSMTREELSNYVIELMSKVRQPEEVTNDNFDFDFLTNNDFVANALAEHSALKMAAAEGRQVKQDFEQLKKQSALKEDEFQSEILTLQHRQEETQRINRLINFRYLRRENNKPYIHRAAHTVSIIKFLYWALPLSIVCGFIYYLKSDSDTRLAVFGTYFTVIPVVVSAVLLVLKGRFWNLIHRQKRRYLMARLVRRRGQSVLES